MSYRIVLTVCYLDNHFLNDMNSRGLNDYLDLLNLPETGPYTSGEDFFKYYWDTEAGNLYLAANDRIEQEWIDAGRMTKELSLTNNNYYGVTSFTFASKADGDEFESRDTEVASQVETVVSAEDPLNYESKIDLGRYVTPTGLRIVSFDEMIAEYFNTISHDHI